MSYSLDLRISEEQLRCRRSCFRISCVETLVDHAGQGDTLNHNFEAIITVILRLRPDNWNPT